MLVSFGFGGQQSPDRLDRQATSVPGAIDLAGLGQRFI